MQQANGEEEEMPLIYGMGPTLLQEYQQKVQELRQELDQKSLLTTSLQNDSESLINQSDQDQKVMTN